MIKTSEPLSIDRSQANEDYPLSAVPPEARKSIWSLAPLLIGFTLYSGTLFAGGIVGSAYRFWPDLISVIVLSNLILGVYAAALSYIGAKSGLTTVLMARFSFGNLGSRWVDFLLCFTQIGWYAWGSAFMAELLNQLVGLPKSFNWLVVLFFTYAFCTTAYMGYLAMDWLSRLAVPVMLILMAWGLTGATADLASLSAAQVIIPQESLSVGEAMTIIVGTFISGATQVTNWSRFANSGRTAILSALLAFFLGNGFLIFSGAYCFFVYGQEDIVKVMAQQELLVGALALFFLNMWTTQDNTIYAFSVAGANMFRTKKRDRLVFLGATIALFLAWSGIYNFLVDYLILLGTFIPPIGGILMADYWLNHQGRFPSLDSSLPTYNWAGITAYILACAIAVYGPGIRPINGIIAAAVLYLITVGVSSLFSRN
ncbi:cytosine permease [Lyngbya aestuarii]|uniref:cytosine permease n=1 Tax=Lyngbya aestuarii TaxID=118322 RepID=UPI00403DA071